jgi:glycosyltransferase involved in cell wall biosynthesis
MELIIIDDFSKDATPEIIDSYVKDTKFNKHFKQGITFIRHETNKGAFFSLNEGLKKAKGDFVTMINTDDYYGSNRFNKLVSACEEYGTEFVFGGVNVIDQNDEQVDEGYGKALMKYQNLIPKCPTVSMALTRGNGTISTGNMLFTKRLYNQLKGFANYKYIHDWDFALRASLEVEPVFVKDAIYNYRVHTGNTIAEISNDRSMTDALEKPEGEKTLGMNPLIKHFMAILSGEFRNKKIPDRDIWDYFVKYKKYYNDDDDILWAWNEANRIVERLQ